MSNNRDAHEIRSAWQADEAGGPTMSADDLRLQIDRVSRRVSSRMTGGLIVCALVLVGWVYVWWVAPVRSGVGRAGVLLTCVAVGVLAFELIASRELDEKQSRAMSERGGSPSLAFHRWQLERQRDFHRGKRFWIRLVLLAGGGTLFFIAFGNEHPEVGRTIHLELVAAWLLSAAAIPVNAWLARRYQRQLDELDNLRKDR